MAAEEKVALRYDVFGTYAGEDKPGYEEGRALHHWRNRDLPICWRKNFGTC